MKRGLRFGLASAILGVLALIALDRAFPPVLRADARDFARVVTDRDGAPLRAFPDRNGVWRYPVTLDDVAPAYLEALVAYEDRWFWRHPGVNPVAIARAAWQNVRSGRVISGGSTLTQQVARLLHPRPRSVRGKLIELLRALQLEARYDKAEILTLYLNYAPFGGTLEGVQAASYAYLGKPASSLTDAEAALLAVLPQAPSRLRPDRHPERAQRARDKVLRRLAERGFWSHQRVDDALAEWVTARQLDPPRSAPLLARRLAAADPGAAVIQTTLDGALQRSLERHVAHYITRFAEPVSAAVLVLHSATLETLAYVGSADFLGDRRRAGHVDMIRALRSPGSTLKPFVYGLALDDGLIHSESLLIDAPRVRARYRPTNFGGGFNGPVGATEALRRSLNLPAVQLLENVGPGRFADRLRGVGLPLTIPADGRPSLALALGGAGTRLEALVGAYRALGHHGVAGRPRYRRADPRVETRLLSPGAAWITRAMLTPAPQGRLAPGRQLAWKTGTSYGFRDAWAIGVDGAHTVAVWIGRPDGTPMPGRTGSTAAVPLLHAVFHQLPRQGDAAPAPPDSVERAEICWPLGTLRDAQRQEHCQQVREAWILNGGAPRTLPGPDHPAQRNPLPVWMDASTRRVVGAQCRRIDDRRVQVALWPRALEPWLAPEVRREKLLGEAASRCGAFPGAGLGPRIVGLPASSRRLVLGSSWPTLRLRAPGGQGLNRWFVNGRYVAGADDALSYLPSRPGRYQFAVVDESGATDQVELLLGRG